MTKFMKNLLILCSYLSILCAYAQSSKSDFTALYQLNYLKNAGSTKITKENQVLIVKQDGTSYFMFETMIALDSIQKVRPLAAADVMLYRSPLYYLIKRKAETVTHFELLGNDILKFDEQIDFDWKLANENKMISGYNCKKATVSYGGRDWIAWYADEIPVGAGPYKFYGLPGLILELFDTDNLFHFNVLNVKTGTTNVNNSVSNYFITGDDKAIQEIGKTEFYKLRTKYSVLSLREKFKYQNRAENDSPELIITSVSGEKLDTNRKPKNKNFIEKYD